MKAFVITLLSLEKSVEVADRCIESARKFGVEVEKFPAIYKDVAEQERIAEGLKLGNVDSEYSDSGAVTGLFVSQYRIWKKIAASSEPGLVLEHDAVFVKPLPNLEGKGDVINLGKPSYGRFKKKWFKGVYPFFSKKSGCLPGTHAYYLTPKGARHLIKLADSFGVEPCDLFLNKERIPDLKEAYPWPIEAHDSFSTIQFQNGSKAKHNFSDDFEHL